MSGPAAIASLNPAAVAHEIDRLQTKLNHPAGLKPTASKNKPHPHLPSLTDIQRRASQPKDIAGTAACDTTRESLTLPDYTHPRST